MKHLIRNAFVAVLSVGFAGCEWSGGGDSNSWNDSGTIANFTGSYHGSGGYLVSEYSFSSVGSSSSSSSASNTDVLVTQSLGSYGGLLVKVYSGTLASTPITPGSVTLSFSGDGGSVGSFHAGSDGNLTGSYTAMSVGDAFSGSGFVDHTTGAWRLQLSGDGTFSANVSITATYRQILNASSSTSASSSGGGSGASGGISIYSFNVQQSGNKIKIIDNNGSVYEGGFGDMRTTGNLGAGSQGSTFVNGDQVMASFSASGRSAAGVNVNMTGNFQGTVQGVSTVTTRSGDSTVTTTTSMALSDRRIIGTWIEDGGKTGNISGVSDSAVNVSTSSSTSTNAP